MKYVILILLTIMTVGVFSCTDDFLESNATEFISAERIDEVNPYNPAIFDGTVRGLYLLMIQTGTGGTDLDHDDFGQKGYDIYLDLLSSDMALGGYNYGWYSNIAKMASTTDYTDLVNYKPWRYYFRIIYGANAVIDGLGGTDAKLTSDEEKWQMGQAKAMRAHSYFYLASMFANNYDLGTKILPIYSSLEQTAQPLSSASDVWDFIIDDLEKSVALLEGFSGDGPFSVTEDVANGMLAYAYLTVGRYGDAAVTADNVISSGYEIVPKAKVANPEIQRNAFSYVNGDGADWIWGVDITYDQGLDLVSWWGQCDVFTYSYAAVGDPKCMDQGLFSSIPTYDARKNWFGAHPWYGIPNCPTNKFYDERRTMLGQREVTADYVYMRVEEMYLIKAEAEAFDSKDEDARTTLRALLEQRIGESMIEDPDNEGEMIVDKTAEENLAYLDGLSGQDLKDEIYKQWRIEMWGEGKSYFAMKRNKATIVRGDNHLDFAGDSFSYDDDRLTFDIPYQEIQDNPNISQ